MTIIKNKNLPNDKIVFVAFSELKGMGRTRGLNISHIWGFSKKVNMKYITDWYHKALSLIPPRYYVMEEKLGQINQGNINILLITRNYKSFRYQFSLPLRDKELKLMRKQVNIIGKWKSFKTKLKWEEM